MKNPLCLLLLLSCLATSQSTLLSVSAKTDDYGRTLYLLFDKNPETYYTRSSDSSFGIEFYNTIAGSICAEKINALTDGTRMEQRLTPPFPILRLSLPLLPGGAAELLPFPASYVVKLRLPGREKLWERRFTASGANAPIAPEKMALYKGDKQETLFLTFPPATRNVLVRSEKGRVSVEQFGIGVPLSRETCEPKSKFVDEIAFTTLRVDSAASEGVTLMDFSVGRKTKADCAFVPNGLKIRFYKD